MTSLARVASVDPSREAAVANNPCPVQVAVVKYFPEVRVSPAGIDRVSFIDALRARGFGSVLCKVLDKGLSDAAKANGKDGSTFNSDDIRKSAFFDGLTTGIFRNGFNATRFDELTRDARLTGIEAQAIARMVRAVAAEQNAGLKAQLFTLFEYSALRYAMAGSAPLKVFDLEDLFRNGHVTDRFADAGATKGLPGVLWSVAKSLAAYGAQAALGESVIHLTPLPPPTTVATGADVAVKRCPFHHG